MSEAPVIHIESDAIRRRIEELVPRLHGGLLASLDIKISRIEADRVLGTMPCNERTCQPFGIIHGGALSSLAETLASVGGIARASSVTAHAMGQQVSINLIRPVPFGSSVTGEARCQHNGRTSQVWDVTISMSESVEKLVAVARVLIAVVEK
jgi:uncharacterized protein (TIGR00369 family)